MIERPFGWTGIAVPVVGQGTWNMERDDRAGAVAAIRAGLELGMRHIDTAELYGAGRVEALVGEAIAGRRDEVFLASKVMPNHASQGDAVHACERSLQQLGTDRLDLYLLHWREPETPLAETFAACERLQRDGKIVHFGVSNFNVADLEAAVAIVGEGRIACNQVLYHLQERAVEHAVLPWCERHGMAVVGYSPFGAGAFPPAPGPAGRTLAAVARRHGATARQVALAFLTRRPSLFAIPKAARVAHVRENGAAAALSLTAADLAEIDAAFPRGPQPRALPTA